MEEKPVWISLRFQVQLSTAVVHLFFTSAETEKNRSTGDSTYTSLITHAHSDNTFTSLNMTRNLPPPNQRWPRTDTLHTKFPLHSRYKFPKDKNPFFVWGSEATEESCEVKGCTVLWERAAVEIRLLSDRRGRWGGRAKTVGYDPLKYLHCRCQQDWDSFRKRNSLKVLTIEGKIRGVIKRGEPFEGISGELIHAFLWKRAFGE